MDFERDKKQFMIAYAASYLGSIMADDPCNLQLAQNQAVEDAFFNAKCAWETLIDIEPPEFKDLYK